MKEKNTFIQQEHIQLIKNCKEYIYNATKGFFFKWMLFFWKFSKNPEKCISFYKKY